jgi:hypothetical protein
MSLALAVPIKDGRRNVPPAPGIIASLVSGRATVDVDPKTRKVVVRASSRPPPNAPEETAEIVGMGRKERRVKVSRRVVRNCFVLDFGQYWCYRRAEVKDILVSTHSQPLLQVCASAECLIGLGSQNQSSCRTILGLIADLLDLLTEVGKQLSRDRISCCRAIEREDAYVASVWCGYSGHFYR